MPQNQGSVSAKCESKRQQLSQVDTSVIGESRFSLPKLWLPKSLYFICFLSSVNHFVAQMKSQFQRWSARRAEISARNCLQKLYWNPTSVCLPLPLPLSPFFPPPLILPNTFRASKDYFVLAVQSNLQEVRNFTKKLVLIPCRSTFLAHFLCINTRRINVCRIDFWKLF